MKEKCVKLFKDGLIGLEQLAAVDGLCDIVFKEVGASNPITTYNIKLSIFTSVPDFWAIRQLFPILPIHRLDEKPNMNGVLLDLTCDIDGKINHFINGKDSFPLHEVDGKYYLGMFLGGAYQEALGGLHNLFDGPSIVRVVQSDGPHCFAVTLAESGPSCADVLRTMHHEPEVMYEALKRRAEEYGDGEAHIACRLARAFDSMPYLLLGYDVEAHVVEDHCSSESGVNDEDDCVEWYLMQGLSM